jgi:hypothetical protein
MCKYLTEESVERGQRERKTECIENKEKETRIYTGRREIKGRKNRKEKGMREEILRTA